LEVAVEVGVDAAAPDGALGAPWRITGRIDRLEIIPGRAGAPDGVRPVDFKTGKTPVSRADGITHPQLGVYQLALRAGGAERADGTRITGEPAGAELVYLRNASPTQREQPALDESADPAWAQTLVAGIAEG
ncbi:PD-(D/E)XK nuclease family protein, partial [Bradyrhizobium sp. BRP05]|nr:PD-(D/E)XK nuclease family protein [Bradyrhizobium sp. BRP05]